MRTRGHMLKLPNGRGVFSVKPSKTTAHIPSLRPYDYAMVGHKLVIVDPTNKVIADVLTK